MQAACLSMFHRTVLTRLHGVYERTTLNFLHSLQTISSYRLHSVDGEIGHIRALFFDDVTGAVRYLMVASPYWLQGQPVLISPIAVGDVCDTSRTISVQLTREQIAGAPRLSKHMQISRAYEQAYFQHYNWPPYWEHDPVVVKQAEPAVDTLQDPAGLCSSQSFIGLNIIAEQSVVGKLEHLILDLQYWRVRYLGINASDVVMDKTVLINLAWIEQIDLQQRRVKINMSREYIQHAPLFDPDKPLSRTDEENLFHYHRCQPY